MDEESSGLPLVLISPVKGFWMAATEDPETGYFAGSINKLSESRRYSMCGATGCSLWLPTSFRGKNSVHRSSVFFPNLVSSMFACSGEKTDPSKTSSPARWSPCDANTAVAPPTPTSKGQQEVFFNSEYLKFWTRAASRLARRAHF